MLGPVQPSVLGQLADATRRATDRWLAMTPAKRAEVLDRQDAAREAERDEWLRSWIADERQAGLEYVTHLLDNMALSVGLDPYLAWRRPRANERADRLAETTAGIRRDLVAAGHRPVTSALESTGIRVVTDETVAPDTFELRDHDGNVLGTFEVPE